jgi:hypothetical protein
MRKNSAGSGGTTTLALRKKASIQQFTGYPNILFKKNLRVHPSASPGRRPLVELAEICLTDGALLITCIITVFILPLSAISHSPPSDSDDTALLPPPRSAQPPNTGSSITLPL